MNRFFVLISCLKVTQAKLACHIFFTLQKLDFKPKEKIFDYIVCSIFSFLYKAISWHDRKKIYKSTSWIIGDTIDQARLIIRNESQDVYICLPLDNSPETSNQSFFFLSSFLPFQSNFLSHSFWGVYLDWYKATNRIYKNTRSWAQIFSSFFSINFRAARRDSF